MSCSWLSHCGMPRHAMYGRPVVHAPMKASPDGLTRPPLSAKWASLLSTSSLSTPISSRMLIAGVHTCRASQGQVASHVDTMLRASWVCVQQLTCLLWGTNNINSGRRRCRGIAYSTCAIYNASWKQPWNRNHRIAAVFVPGEGFLVEQRDLCTSLHQIVGA